MKKSAKIMTVVISVFLLFTCFAPLTGHATPHTVQKNENYQVNYTKLIFTVTWNNWDGSLLEQDTDVDCGTMPSYDSAEPERPVTVQYDYVFSGWSPAVEAVTGDVTYTAQFTSALKSYTVTFKDYSGAVLGTDTVEYGSGATDPEPHKRAGYHFKGWNTDFHYVTGDATVTAQYAINTYKVRFLKADGKTRIGDSQTVNWGCTVRTETAPEIAGTTFKGWNLNGDNPSVATNLENVRENIEATATYKALLYTVTFVDYNGDVIKIQTVEWNAGAASPDPPARDGYKFAGWDVLFDNITKDTVVTAKYEAEAVTSPISAAVIATQPIPQTGDVQGWMLWLLLIPGILILWLVIAVRLSVVPVAESLADNGNGTYSIQWGYDNRKNKRYTVGEDKSVFTVITGKLIKSSANPPVEFKRGRAEGVFTTIVDKNAEVQWKINNRKVKVDLKKLE